ncbi:MAG TPA: NUDIX domain-containing protein [Dermatophilaceae bacterium]|jgi:8-oxo-dGTP pyrophosphatase MutT (NUDIX family)
MSLPAPYRLLHEDTTRRLSAWRAPGTDQERLRAGCLAHLAAHPDAMWKQGPPAHFTASCLVLDHTGSKALLTLHRKAGAWFQFGGHFEPGDSGAHTAAQREAREESGIMTLVARPELVQLDRHQLAGSFGRCREHLDLRFVAVADQDCLHVVSEESLDVRWWPADALPRETRHDLEPLVTAARSVLGLG